MCSLSIVARDSSARALGPDFIPRSLACAGAPPAVGTAALPGDGVWGPSAAGVASPGAAPGPRLGVRDAEVEISRRVHDHALHRWRLMIWVCSVSGDRTGNAGQRHSGDGQPG